MDTNKECEELKEKHNNSEKELTEILETTKNIDTRLKEIEDR